MVPPSRQFAICIALAIVTTSSAAAADPVVIKQMFIGLVAESPLEGETLTSSGQPDKTVRMVDGGTKIGAGARTTVVYHRMRGSFGFGAFGVRGARMLYDPRLDVATATSAGAFFELAAGYEFRVGPLFPYTDLRAQLEFASVSLQVRSPECGEQALPLSAKTYVGIGPAIGVFVPIEGYFFVDLSGYAGVVGERGLGAFGGLGAWFPTE